MARPRFSGPRRVYAVIIGGLGYGLLLAGLYQQAGATPADHWLYALVLLAVGVIFSAIGTTLPNSTTYVGLEATAYYAAMIGLGPWLAGLVALGPVYRWRATTARATNWAFFRNGGMYALMGIAGGLVYQAAGDTFPVHFVTPWTLLGLALAEGSSWFLNELIIFGNNLLQPQGLRRAVENLRNILLPSWGVEVLAYLPALFTGLVWAQIGWEGLIIWLLLLTAGAVALDQLARARTDVTGRLAELSAANARMQEHNELETQLAADLSLAAEDLAGYASRLAVALYQQHAAVAEITSTVEQLAEQARYIADAAGAVDTTSEEALVTAGRGQEAAASSVQAMEDLERNVYEMNSRMTILEGRSRLIHRTLQTINNISNETHLLALSATIEAAGALGQGRRFSVVAQQINALADQALQAAGDIQVTVREIEAATANTKDVIEQGLAETRRYTSQVDEARRSMEVILSAVGRASEMAQQIRQATEQQTQASSQVTDAMREIAVSMGAASSEGSAVYTAAENLRRMAYELRRLGPQSEAPNG